MTTWKKVREENKSFQFLFKFAWRIPHFVYGATWTLFLTLTVAIISLAPEFAFVSAIFPSSSEVFSRRHIGSAGSSLGGLVFTGESFPEVEDGPRCAAGFCSNCCGSFRRRRKDYGPLGGRRSPLI
uniref:Uncharacterized protein At2g37530 n=1 Tax=Arabidopsis thaliana TaxID=3702 RepID=O80923_ARATH|nr:hypothetical protein [Arabidopsis thaliana]